MKGVLKGRASQAQCLGASSWGFGEASAKTERKLQCQIPRSQTQFVDVPGSPVSRSSPRSYPRSRWRARVFVLGVYIYF